MMKEVIEEIKIFIDKHEKTDPPLFVYYEPMKTDKKGKVSKNTGFLTTMDESIYTVSGLNPSYLDYIAIHS